jgi:hypothetical protein
MAASQEVAMKIPVTLSLLLLAAPALAQTPPPKSLCVDASRDSNYNARPISLHEVLARNATGDRRGARIKTTCIHIDRAANVALRSMTQCIGLGDTVSVGLMGGPNETCRVTGVSLVPEDYATAKYK